MPATPRPSGVDIYDTPLPRIPSDQVAQGLNLSLKQPPRWLRRPVSASFGFGGKLVTVSNLSSAHGKTQSSVVHLRGMSSEATVIARVKKLKVAEEEGKLEGFAQSSVGEQSGAEETWKALLSLFRSNSREELITLLGYSKEEVKARIEEAAAKLKEARGQQTTYTAPVLSYTADEELDNPGPRDPVVSFLDPEPEVEAADTEKTGSEVSTSDAPPADGESSTTAPSLFGDDAAIGAFGAGTGADFFSTIAAPQDTDINHAQTMVVPHMNYGIDSSVAATMGSGPSSVASENLSVKNNTFKIYPTDESETERLITRALVLGDFWSAVELCLSAERYADALLLSIKGGDDLLQRTQKAYFESQTTKHPYLRLFQSIITNDLDDVVQNADLTEWAEVFVVLCTFASRDEFGGLAEQLGARLEFQAGVLRAESEVGSEDSITDALELRKRATLTYLAAGRLERLVNIWIDELAEEEGHRGKAFDCPESTSRYATHAHALQTFIEKVTVFRGAVKYVDGDLSAPIENTDGAFKSYKLAALYDRYFEYAEMLAAQGLVKEAVAYLKLTPEGYTGSALDFAAVRERLLVLSGQESRVPNSVHDAISSSGVTSKQPVTTYRPTSVLLAPATSVSGGSYTPAQPPAHPVYQSHQRFNTGSIPLSPHPPTEAIVKPPGHGAHTVPPPIRPPISNVPLPHAQNGYWNDPPVVKVQRGTPSSISVGKSEPIVSPFPNAMQSPPTPGSPFTGHGPNVALPPPPPPRPTSVQARPPPPQRGPPPARSISTSGQPPVQPPPHASGAQYTSPSLGPVPLGEPPGPYMRATPPPGPSRGIVQRPGPYARATPPPGPPVPAGVSQHPGPYGPPPSQASLPSQQQPGPYAPPPSQAPQGPYAPPPSQAQGSYAPPLTQAPQGSYAPPPPQSHSQPGPYGPPPTSVSQGPPIRGPPQTQHPLGGLPPQQHGPPQGGPSAPSAPARAPAPPRGPPPPKYRK